MSRLFGWARRRTVALVVTVALMASVLTLVAAPNAAAASGTILFQNAFNDKTVDGSGTVTVPTSSGGTNLACLTAAGNTSVLPLLSCSPAPDVQGSGTLRFTSATGNQVGGVFGSTSFPSSNGLDVTFNTYQYGGGGADGMGFVLAAVDPANPVPPAGIGPSGGSLGYTPAGSLNGLTNAYLGVGLDTYGNFSNSSGGFTGSGCATVSNISARTAGAVVVRGPGNAKVGYCALTSTYTGTSGSLVALRGTTRANSLVPVEVLINPTATAFTSASGITVAAGTYKVVMTPVGGTAKTLTGGLPVVPSTLYPSTSWLSGDSIPKQLAFGFVGSTGSVTDAHEVGNVKVLTFNPVPQLAVATTSYSASSTVAGGPVNYSAVASVLAGADETSAISVTQTLPTGAVPVGAYGTGWVCGAPSGQTISCTTTATSFPNGTVLPAITIVGIVTASTMTASVIQNSSSTSVGSSDANPGTDAVMAPGTVSAAPSGVTASPAVGPLAGGGSVTISGIGSTPPTALEIGTTAEQAAGTPVVLLPCVRSATANCFNISGTNIVIPSMPARAAAASVSITVVTLGVAATVGYVYADKPSTPAAPTATAGILSDTVNWVAPAINGSAITGYILTPYLNNVAQTAINYDASSTTKTFTGLTAGASYTYTVAAINAYGTSNASAKSVAVIPYTVPGAPTIAAASAGDSSATLTWTAPASNGSSTITGYVVTPYIGSTAQTPQTFATAALSQTLTGLTPGTAYSFTVAAVNAAGAGPPSAKSAVVTPNVSPSITGTSPPTGEVGAAYSKTITVSGGTAPFVWSVSTGSLPPGVTLNASTGVLSGTPTASGSFPVTIQVVDASNQSASTSVILTIAAAPVVSFTPAAGEVSIAYTAQPTVAGGTSAYTWAVTGGSLPAGLALNTATGQINGTPTVSGSFTISVSVTDSLGQVASKSATIVVAPLPTMTAASPAAGQVGVAYSSTTFAVTGGTLPVTWSLAAGSLPPGLSLAGSTGVLSGTPTTAATYSFTVSAVDANGVSAGKAVTLVVAAGPLVITKTANVSSAVVGATVLYTITVANSSSTAFTGVSVSDPLTGVLDDATYNANATATVGTASYAAPTVSWTGNVAANATVTITYSVTVSNPDTGNKVLSNTVASTTLGGNCAASSTDIRCTATVTVAGLNIAKTADVASTTPGSVVHYSVVVTNSGQSAYTGAAFTDPLGGVLDDAAYNGDAGATTGSVSYSGASLVWTGNLAVGASSTITYSVTVADPDTGDRSLTGTIVSAAAGSSCPSGNAAASCSATVTVLVPALVISNTSTLTSTTPGSVVPYTVTLSNTGQTAYTGTTVTVALSAALDDATYNNNAAASAGSVAYSAGPGTLTWTGNLAVGAVVTITASVTVNNPDAGDKVLTTVASASAAGSTCPTGSTNSACRSTVTVLIPALAITKSADVSTTTPGAVVRYTISATNNGQTVLTAASFSDPLTGVLDDASYGGNAAATAGSVSYGGSTLTWTGNLAIGATATLTYTVTVNQPDNGNRVLANAVTSSTAGNNCAAGSTDNRCTSTVAVLVPALTISTAADNATPAPGSVVRYTVTLDNTGQTSYTGATATLDFSGVGDDATYNADATASAGSVVANAGGTFTVTFSLVAGASSTVTLSFTVNTPDTGDRSLKTATSSDAAGSTCPTGSTNTACSSAVTVLIPGLLITKTANMSSVVPGGTVTYTVTVLNTGQTTYAAASFTDSLASVLTDATYGGGATATVGIVGYSAPTLTWTGALAPGAASTISYTVTVHDPDPGDKRMSNTVVSNSAGSNCAGGSADARCTAAVNVLVPALTIVKTANAATAAPGAVVGFTIKVTNTGATAYGAATFTDSLAGVTDDAAYNANVAATAGTATFASGALSWTGALAIGASATITYSSTVNAAAGGDNVLANTVVSASSGSNCAGGSIDTRCTVSVLVTRLVISRSYDVASTTPGSTVTATATFTNAGQVAYTGISIALDGSSISDDATRTGGQTASSGTLSLSGSTLTWSGNIAVGAVVTVVGSFIVNNPDTGDRSLAGTWVSAAVGNNCPAGGSDVRCTNAIPVLIPALTISMSANVTAVVPGGAVAYTITVANTGQTAYTDAVVADSLAGVLDDATYNAASASASSGTLSYSSPTLTWTGDVAVGATVTITYAVTTFSPDPGDKTMVNSVASSAAGSSCLPANGSVACRSTVVVLTPGLTIVKTANFASANLGATVVYTVTVTNSGQVPYSAASFDDSLAGVADDATYNAGATTASVGTATFASGSLSWTGGLSVGQVATITYSVTVNSPDTGDRSLGNTVVSSATGSNCPASSIDSRCTTTVSVVNSTVLTLNKTADVSSTVAGGVIRYTATITNSSAAAVPSATFTDALTGVLDDAVYNADAFADSGTLTFASPNLTWTGAVAAGATVTVTYSFTVRNPLTGDDLLTDTLVSASLPGSNNCVTGSNDTRCTTAIPVAALDLSQVAAETTATPGSVVHLTAVYTNTGQVPYTGISVVSPRADTSDDTIPTGDQVASSGTVVRTATSVIWTGDIPVGGTVTITRTLVVQNPDPGNQRITATLSSDAAGNNCGSGSTDPRCTFLITVLTPALTITMSSSTPVTMPGGTVGYTITVRNTGQTAYTGASFTDDLNGLLTDATLNAAQTTVGALTYSSPRLTWTGDLAVGATATITYSVTVFNPDPGDKTMVTSVSSTTVGNTCPPASGNAACTNTVAVLTPALTIVKTSSVLTATLGSAVTYTVQVRNSGQTGYAAATFSDSLANVLDDAVYNPAATTATSGTTGYSGGVLTWTGALAVGAVATLTYTVTTNIPSTGDRTMDNTIVSPSAGSNCAAGSSDTRCTTTVAVVNSVTLTFSKTADVLSTVAGGVVHYTVTATNSSSQPITGADFTDPLGGILDDAGYDANATASAGTVTFANSELSWTGAVPAGGTITLTYSVTVHAAATGDQILVGTVTSGSNQVSNNCLPGNSGPGCTSTVPVAALLIQQSYAESTTTPGSVVHLSATFTNTGKFAYQGISISSPSADAVDDAIPAGDQTASSGTLVLTSSAIVWTGDIPVGATVTIAGTLTVRNPDLANKLLSGTLVSAAPGNNCPSGGTDSRCTATSAVLLPGLTITKSVDATTATPGDIVRFTVAVHNSGQTPYTGAVVTDSLVGVLDDAIYNADAATTSGVVSFASSTVTYTGDLAVNQTATITYSVTVRNPDPGDKSMVDSAVSNDVGSTCLPGSGTAACRSSVDVLTPGLTIVKTANATAANLGSSVSYTVIVTNSGQTPYPAATFDDSLAGVVDDASYEAAATTVSIGNVSFASGTLAWSGALAPGQSSTISYTVTVNSPDTGDRLLTNTVVSTAAANNCSAASTDGRCTAIVAVTNSAAITFTRAADVLSTVAGGVVRYSVSVANSSGATAAGVTFTDSLAGVVDDAVYNGDLAGDGTPSYGNNTVSWTGSVPAGSTVLVTFSVTVDKPLAGDNLLTDTLVSGSPTASNNCLAGSTDTRCRLTVPVASLTIAQHYTETSTTPGSLIHLTGTFTNTGQVPYTGISVVSPSADVVDDAVPVGDQGATSGNLTLGATAITWTGDIPVGVTVTITGTLTVDRPDTGNRTISGTLSSAAVGNNCPIGGTDVRCTAAIPVRVPGLSISTSASAGSVVPGGTVGYTVTIVNSGETPYSAATVVDNLAGLLDDATYNGDAVPTTGTVSPASQAFVWTGDLAVGATATIGFTVTALRPANGDKAMTNAVGSGAVGSTCPLAGGTDGCAATVLVLTPALSIVTTANAATAVPGSTVSYSIVVVDTGQTNYRAASVRTAFAGLSDDADYNNDAAATSGTITVTSGVLTWSSALTMGASATITFSFTVRAPGSGDFRLQQSVTSSNQGNDCPVGGVDPRCSTSVAIAGLRLVTVADRATAQPTDVVLSTSTFTNTGQVPYFGITIDIDLSGTVDDSTYNGDGTSTAGSVGGSAENPVLVWTGDLAVGATVVVTSSSTVNNPDIGDKVISTVVSTTAAASNCPVVADSPAPACSSKVTVQTPALTITTSVSATTATPGSSVSYTITAVNSGQTTYTAGVITDSLAGLRGDAKFTAPATASRGSVVFTDPTLTWTGDLLVGQSVVITYSVVIDDPDLGDKTLSNRVTSGEIGSTCPTGGTSTACTTTVTVTVPALAIAVSADSTSTTPGSTVGYTITITNTGQTAYTGATVTARLAGAVDDAAYRGGATSDVGTVAFTSPELTWTGTLGVGATATVTYSLTVNDPDVGDRLLSTAVSSPAPGSTCTVGVPCVNSVTVLIPGLAVSTSASVGTATPGDLVVFTTTVHNSGQTAYVETSLTSSLSALLDDATVSSITSTAGVTTYTAPTLTWTGSLPVGATAVITYSATVRNPDPGNRVLTATVVAPAAGSTCPAGSANPSCVATVTVLVPALTMTTSTTAPTTTPGSVVIFTVVLTNSGQTPYSGAVVDDSLQGLLTDAAYRADATVVGGGTVSYAAPTLTWTGDLAVAASVTITFSVLVDSPDRGDKRLVNVISSSVPGSTCPPGGTGPSCSTTVTVLVPGLAVTKAADVSTVTAGNLVHYTITLTNTGETAYSPATFTDALGAVLDDASWNGDAAATNGTVSLTNDTLAWSGAIAIGDTVTVTYSLTTRYPATGDHVLSNAVVSPSPGSSCLTSAPAHCRTAVVEVVPALTIVKTADIATIAAGGTVHYTILATNTGQADYPAASLTDSLSDVTDDAGYDNNGVASVGSLSFSGDTLNWSGALPRNATVLITYSVKANVADTGNAVMVNKVVSTSTGSNCPATGVDPRCATSTEVAARFLTLSGLADSFTLTGLPNTTVTGNGVVSMKVTTNDVSGYTVTVQPAVDALVGHIPDNPDTLPVGDLSVRASGASVFQALLTGAPTVVHQQNGPSGANGDAVTNDFQVQIPFITADTYSGTLEYIVSAQ